MDYSILAAEWLSKMRPLHSAKLQKNINEALRGEIYALHFLVFHDGEALPGEISNEMNVSSARIAQTLNGMEKKGWISRRIDTSDRRRILVNLTPEGKLEAKKHMDTALGHIAKMLALLGEQDAKEYVRITGRLAEIIRDNE
jgi:DNA-binding MarR family transcriptional regulator